jgi:hypothetical protein
VITVPVSSEELEPGYHCEELVTECPIDTNFFQGTIAPNRHLGTEYPTSGSREHRVGRGCSEL